MQEIILGSNSPRRKEIFSFFSIPFTQISSDFDEDSIVFEGDPISYVQSLANAKAQSLQKKHPDKIIITADTIVYQNGKVFNKPLTEKEACEFLTLLQGKWHSVFTSVVVTKSNRYYQDFEETKVLFNALNQEQIKQYHTKMDWKDKAGGYAIQFGGGIIIKKIDGCYYNVVGLPINTLHTLFKKIDIDLWDYVR